MARIRLTALRSSRDGPLPRRGSLTGQGGEAAAWLATLARVGYAAKGLLYLVIGALAALAAVGSGGGATDSRGAISVIGGSAAGRVLLVAMGAGMLAYALWAVIAAWYDVERRGGDARGVALRIGLAGRALIYGALGAEAIRLLLTDRPSSGDGAEHWTARLLALPAGQWLVAAAGAAVIGYALYQGWLATRKDLRTRVQLADTGAAAPWALRLGRFGIGARGVVFLIIGSFLVQAALLRNAERAGGIDESLATLASQPYGPVLMGVVATGLMAYGLWQVVKARYRELDVRQSGGA